MGNRLIWIRIWDLLAWLLIVFPFFTGGVWIQKPGIYLELSDLTVPVLVVSGFGLILYFLNFDLQKTYFIRFFEFVFRKWTMCVQHKPRVMLWSIALLFGLIWSFASLKKHWAFGTHAGDLGIFTSAIWNLTHGNGYISSFKHGINLFEDHQSPIFWVLYPVFKIFPYPETLLITQGLGLAVGGPALYFLARQWSLDSKHQKFFVFFPFLYWLYFPTRSANAFDFHPEIFMLPLALWMVWAFQARKWLLGTFLLIGTLASKESAAPIVSAVGLCWILGAFPSQVRILKKIGIVFVILGILVFYFDLKVPTFFSSQYPYLSRYTHLGESLFEVIFSPILNPKAFWAHFLSIARVKFLFFTLLPLGFLPLFSLKTFLISIPAYLMLFMDQGDHRVQLNYHYSIEPSIGLFLSLTPGFLRLFAIVEGFSVQRVISYLLLFFCLVTHGRSELYRIRYYQSTTHHKWLRHELFPCLSGASFSATASIAPYISNRQWVQHLPILKIEKGKDNERDVECILYDPHVNNVPVSDEAWLKLEEEILSQGYLLEYECNRTKVYRHPKLKDDCLRCRARCETEG